MGLVGVNLFSRKCDFRLVLSCRAPFFYDMQPQVGQLILGDIWYNATKIRRDYR